MSNTFRVIIYGFGAASIIWMLGLAIYAVSIIWHRGKYNETRRYTRVDSHDDRFPPVT